MILFATSVCLNKQSNKRFEMGQSKSKSVADSPLTPEAVEQAFKTLLQGDPQLLTLESVTPPIIILSRQLTVDPSFERNQGGFHVNPLLLRLTHHPEFAKCVKTLLELLAGELRGVVSARVIALVPRDKFSRCLTLANFIVYVSDESMLQNVNLLNVRTDLDPQTREQVNRLAREGTEASQGLLDDLNGEQIGQVGKLLRLAIGLMIDLHLKLITRSDYTLDIVDHLNASCFVLYCKLFLSGRQDFIKREKTENSKALVKMGAYFLGLGVEKGCASLYELAVLVIEVVVGDNAGSVLQSKALPSHLFKSIPIVNNNEMTNWLAVALLYQLKYVRRQQKLFSRLNVNRIPSLRLLQKILKTLKGPTPQITFMLEQLALQTKPNQIQRVYVCALATTYLAFQKVESEVLRRFAEGRELAYNVKMMNRQKKVRPQDVRTELEKDQEDLQKEFQGLCAKYITHVILRRREILYEYSDKALWNLILYHLDNEEEGPQVGGREQEEPQQPVGELKEEPEEQVQ